MLGGNTCSWKMRQRFLGGTPRNPDLAVSLISTDLILCKISRNCGYIRATGAILCRFFPRKISRMGEFALQKQKEDFDYEMLNHSRGKRFQ